MSAKKKKSKKKKKKSSISTTKKKPKRDSKITALANKLNLDLKQQPNRKRAVSDHRVKKKSKLKFTKFEKCPGYEYIAKAEKLEAEKKYTAAVKLYDHGCEELEHYTKANVDNAMEKRKRMERIQEYRQRSLKLQNAALVKKSAKTKQVTKAKWAPFEQEEGYKIVQQALKQQKNDKLEKAIQSYEKGLVLLEKNLLTITDSKEKEHRRNKVREWRSEQQWCKNQLDHADHQRIKQASNSKKTKKPKVAHLSKEPGYVLCKKGEQYEKDKKYDAAITHYQKGIPMLEDTMLYNTDSSSQKRERMKHIETYRHKLQSLKNRKIRRTTIKFKAAKIPAKLKSKRSSSSSSITGGTLYKNIRNGTLTVDVIKYCNRYSMYYMLPIVASSIMHAPLPFQSFIGDPLLEAMDAKIEICASLEQRLRFFLYSYYTTDRVQALFGDHPAMPTIVDASDLMDKEENEKDDIPDDGDHDPFEDSYTERDAILFFRKVALSNYPEVHQEILIGKDYVDIYDIMGKDQVIDKIRIEKIFKSNAKPLLLSTWQKQADRKFKEISRFIIKYGDDCRLDAGAMHMFRFFNSIWSEEGLFYEGCAVHCLLYNVVPMGQDVGAIEYIPGCKALRDISDYFDKFGTAEKHTLVASAAGSYIASFVLGVRDRHFDNVLIQKDGTLFHIDFGYVMGAKLMMDTSKIAVTSDLCKLFDDHWDSFVETAVNAFMTLRLHYQEILDYSDLVFDFVNLESNNSEFLYKMLKMHETDEKAEEIMRHKIASAPSSWNTKIKNAAHYVATL